MLSRRLILKLEGLSDNALSHLEAQIDLLLRMPGQCARRLRLVRPRAIAREDGTPAAPAAVSPPAALPELPTRRRPLKIPAADVIAQQRLVTLHFDESIDRLAR